MKTLDEWADERRHVDDINLEPGWQNFFDEPTPVYLYDCGCIECRPDGSFSLLIERSEWQSRSLERLEGILYEVWAKGEMSAMLPGA